MTESKPTLTLTQKRKLAILERKKILILGAGREGLSTYQFLRTVFPKLTLTIADQQPKAKLADGWSQFLLTDSYLEGSFGKHYLDQLDDFNYVFKTPGIPLTQPLLQQAVAKGCQFTSNTEWFFKLARGKIVGVTGTKGKSTTASLIAHTLTQGRKSCLLLGNIGIAPLSHVTQTTGRTITVMELSAHQLQELKVSPHLAVVQNITSEHLDYYPNTKAYVQAKTSIVRYQHHQDFVIYSDQFPTSREFSTLTPAQPLCYGLQDTPQHLAFASGRALFYKDGPKKLPVAIVDRKKIKLLGKHNLYNLLPALIVAKHFRLPNEVIAAAFASFTPLRHRLEIAGVYNQTTYVNDSLSTTPPAAVAALKLFAPRTIHLLAGGYERHQNFSQLAAQIINQNVPTLILFPPAGKRLKRAVIDLAIAKKRLAPDFFEVTTMTQAITIAKKVAHAQDVVLLSPAAASFGEFKDYADRGDQFCEKVHQLSS